MGNNHKTNIDLILPAENEEGNEIDADITIHNGALNALWSLCFVRLN